MPTAQGVDYASSTRAMQSAQGRKRLRCLRICLVALSLAHAGLLRAETTQGDQIAAGQRSTLETQLLQATYFPVSYGVEDACPTPSAPAFGCLSAHPLVKVAKDGSIVLVGNTGLSLLPVTAGVFQPVAKGSYEIVVIKLKPDLSAPIFATYLGGTSRDIAYGLDVAADGSVWVAGETDSTDFPVTAGSFHEGNRDLFYAHISSDGKTLLSSALVGGASSDGAKSITVGHNGDVYIAGWTSSPDFPITGNAVQKSYAGNVSRRHYAEANEIEESDLHIDDSFSPSARSGDAFVARIHATNGSGTSPWGNDVVYATYLGGIDQDTAFDVAVDANGSAFVTGITLGGTFPATMASFMPVAPDGICSRLTSLPCSADADCPSECSYAEGLCAELTSNIQNSGIECGSNADCAQGYQCHSDLGGSENLSNAFVTKLSAEGDAIVFSTFLGGIGGRGTFEDTISHPSGNAVDAPAHLAIDASGATVVIGTTPAYGFGFGPTFPFTDGAFGPEYIGCCGYEDCVPCNQNSDCGNGHTCSITRGSVPYVAKLSPDGSALQWAAELRGRPLPNFSLTTGLDVDVDPVGGVLFSGYTFDRDFFPSVAPLPSTSSSRAAFVGKVSPDGTSLEFSTTFGGIEGVNIGSTVAGKADGSVYLAGYTSACAPPFPVFPTTAGAWLEQPIGEPGYPCTSGFVARLLPPARCGNGLAEVAEDCDDANSVAGDGCDLACHAMCGDADGNGKINVSDAQKVLKTAVGNPIVCPLHLCDADNNGFVRTGDALRVLRRAVGIPILLNCPAA